MGVHKKLKIISIVVVLLVIAGAGVGGWFIFHREEASTSLVLYGNVDIRQVDLAFQVSERVASVLVEEGDAVTEGQVVATVRTDRLASAVHRQAAQVRSQQQVLRRLEAGSRPQEIKKARADLAAAQARLQDAQVTAERYRSAVKDAAVSRQALDNAEAKLTVARADVKAAQEGLSLALEGPRQEDIAAARATLAAYRAELALARRDLTDANLICPQAGVIEKRILEPGDMASPQVPALTVALTDPLWVRVYVSETDLGKIQPGMAAAVRTDSFPDKTYDGWVGYISPTAEFTPKSVETTDLRTSLVYPVRVYIKNPQNELRLGMPVTVTIELGGTAGDRTDQSKSKD